MLIIIGISVLLYFATLSLYRLKLHPLAKHPGPLLYGLTDWPNVFHSWKGDRPIQMYRMHQRYGPIVRFGPNRIAFCTPSSLQFIYGVGANTRKADWYKIWEQLFGAPSTATILDHKTHSRRKRILQSAFSNNVVSEMEDAVLRNTRIFCNHLTETTRRSNIASGKRLRDDIGGSDWGSSLNLSELVGYLTFDIMGDTIFSTSFKMQNSEENREYLGLSLDALRGVNTVAYIPLLLKLKLDKVLFRDINAGMERYKAYCAEQSMLRTTRESELETKDVWSTLMKTKDPQTGKGFTAEDLGSEAAVLISAASHPVRTSVCALAHYLLRNETCMVRLSNEIRSKFTDIESIRSGPSLSACQYLRARIYETLRLNPGIPGISLRTVLEGGSTIDGEFFPEGTDVGVSYYSLHHNEQCFPNPFSFNPERWILFDSEQATSGRTSNESLRKAKEAFCAFSIGPMACIGKNVAYHQIEIILARMIWLFDIRRGDVAPGYDSKRMNGAIKWAQHGEYPMRDTFSAEGEGPWIQLRSRFC